MEPARVATVHFTGLYPYSVILDHHVYGIAKCNAKFAPDLCRERNLPSLAEGNRIGHSHAHRLVRKNVPIHGRVLAP